MLAVQSFQDTLNLSYKGELFFQKQELKFHKLKVELGTSDHGRPVTVMKLPAVSLSVIQICTSYSQADTTKNVRFQRRKIK